MQHGKLVISLDFELLWGVRDKKTIAQYGEDIRAVHAIIPRLLEMFNNYGVKATFSTVGFLFFENKTDLLSSLPKLLPKYANKNLSPYSGHFDLLKESYPQDKYHFGWHLLQKIQLHPQHEIGTHTFSHYYCLEEGQTVEQFSADIQQAIKVANERGIKISSLVFPRNQFNDAYLKICSDLGITCYRGNEHSWLYEARNKNDEQLYRRALRLVDAYINISGHHVYSNEYMRSTFPVDVPSSRFLRPYSAKLSFLEPLKINRIKQSMTYAAKNNLTYHLWWHPHNFGDHTEENFAGLEQLLKHFKALYQTNNFRSYTMSGLAKSLLNE